MTDEPTYAELAERVAVAEDTLRAIRAGEVDALVVQTDHGPRLFTLEGADAFYRVLIEQMPVGAAAVRHGSVMYANGFFAEMLGLQLQAVIGRPLASLTVDGDIGELLSGGREGIDVQLKGADGPVEVALSVQATEGDALCLVAVDLSQRRAAERAVRDADERFRGAFDEAPIGMALLDASGVAERVNPALAALLKCTPAALLGRPLPWSVDGANVAPALPGLDRAHGVEVRFDRDGSEPIWASLHLNGVRDPAGGVNHYIAQVQDISERRRYEQQLRHVADHDGLTGLLNRRGFDTAINEHLAMCARYGVDGALVLLDLDHFKYVNDERGHHVGDLLLMAVSNTLRSRLRDSDVVARLGGDEFAILLPRGDAAAARTVAEQIVEAARTVTIPELVGMRQVTVSLGVAVIDETFTSAGELMARADLTMYDAKEAGRDQYAVYDAGDATSGSDNTQRMTWLRRIKVALDDHLLQVHAQPIVDLRTGGPDGRELLVRLLAADGGVVPAATWFGIAERYDLATDIDEWMLDRAFELLADEPGGVSVNVSARSIGRPSVLERVRAGLSVSGVEPDRLTVEITETAAIGNIAAAARFVEDLHTLGCRLALDDFGAGFGSFYYLKHLAFDDVKIDGEFVRNSVNDPRDQAIIRAMVDVAASMGRRTVAECIEDEATLELVRSHGVDLAQGYHLGRPAPINGR